MKHSLSEASAPAGGGADGQTLWVDDLSSLVKAVRLLIGMVLDDLVDDWLEPNVSSQADRGFSQKDGTADTSDLDHSSQTSLIPYMPAPADWE